MTHVAPTRRPGHITLVERQIIPCPGRCADEPKPRGHRRPNTVTRSTWVADDGAYTGWKFECERCGGVWWTEPDPAGVPGLHVEPTDKDRVCAVCGVRLADSKGGAGRRVTIGRMTTVSFVVDAECARLVAIALTGHD